MHTAPLGPDVQPAAYTVADRAAHFDDGTLVLADLHLGRDSTSELELPLGERADVLDRLDALLDRFSPRRVVLAGDVLHSFGSVPTDVPGTLRRIDGRIRAADATPIVIAGNHDAMLGSLVDAPVRARMRLDDGTLVVHGHDVPPATAERYVIGHEHPSIAIEGERRPCALDCVDQYDGASVLVLPAFTRLAKGTTVNGMAAEAAMSPLLTDVDACRPIVPTAEEALRFPPLGELRSLL